jgi:hypothetical protein
MNHKVGRVAPRAPGLVTQEDGAHGMTRPTAVNGFMMAMRNKSSGSSLLDPMEERERLESPRTQMRARPNLSAVQH